MLNGDLDRRALAAAQAVARSHGLESDGATIIRSGSNVLVHLRPAPVVARVMTGTVALHDDPRRWLGRELSVLAFLEPSRLAVRPTSLLPPGPHHNAGLWMTFVQWIPDAESSVGADGAGRYGRALRELHEALAPFAGELGTLRDLGDDVARLHAQLRATDDRSSVAIAGLGERVATLQAGVFGSTRPVQALHGDISLRNLLRGGDRLIWNDFEDTLRGPVHWDLASLVGALRIDGATDDQIGAALRAYGWDDASELEPFLAAQDVYDEIWHRYDRQRRQMPA